MSMAGYRQRRAHVLNKLRGSAVTYCGIPRKLAACVPERLVTCKTCKRGAEKVRALENDAGVAHLEDWRGHGVSSQSN